jgi:hypothetical protein
VDFIPDPSATSPSKLATVEEFARAIFDSITSGNGALTASVAVMLILVSLRGLGGKRLPFLKTDVGGASLILGLSSVGAIGNALAAGAAFNGALVLETLTVTLAAGGLELVRKILAGMFGPRPAPAPVEIGPVTPVEVTSLVFEAPKGEPPPAP